MRIRLFRIPQLFDLFLDGFQNSLKIALHSSEAVRNCLEQMTAKVVEVFQLLVIIGTHGPGGYAETQGVPVTVLTSRCSRSYSSSDLSV